VNTMTPTKDASFAYRRLTESDPVLAAISDQVGRPDPFAWNGQSVVGDDLFAGLTLHLVGQQISTAAAFTIYGRLCASANASPLTPQALAELGIEQLRSAGLSTAKARALADLALGALSGAINLEALRTVEDTEAANRLMALRGIGPWSAQMFLLHQLRRPDVLPAGDIGLRTAVLRAWHLGQRPSESELIGQARLWAPFRSYAAALLWASLHISDAPSPTLYGAQTMRHGARRE
jgi:DNA-3-methyladenine glycosylase II